MFEFLIPHIDVSALVLVGLLFFVLFGTPRIKKKWPNVWRKLTITGSILFTGIILFAATASTIFELQFHLTLWGPIIYIMLLIPIGKLYELKTGRLLE